MTDNIKKEARKICEGVFDSMNELDTIDWYFIENRQWKLGFRIDKDAPNKYSVRISGDGIHYSKTLNGLRPHILKKIEQVLCIKRMETEVAMKKKTCKDCKHFEVDTVSAVCEKKRLICDGDAPACNRFEQKSTIFDRITESPETLAEKLVYKNYIGLWCSPFIQWGKDTKAEAIAATVAKLKEVEK